MLDNMEWASYHRVLVEENSTERVPLDVKEENAPQQSVTKSYSFGTYSQRNSNNNPCILIQLRLISPFSKQIP